MINNKQIHQLTLESLRDWFKKEKVVKKTKKTNENIGAIAGGIAAARKKRRRRKEDMQMIKLAKDMGIDVSKYEKYLKEWDIYNKMDWEDDKDEKEARLKNTDRKKIYKDIDEEKDPDSEAERKRDEKHDKLMKKIRRGDALGLGPKRLGENTNPEVHRLVNGLVKKMADRYDYTLQDAVYAIIRVLKSQNYDGIKESNDKKWVADIIQATGDDSVQFDGFDANDRPLFISDKDSEIEYTIDDKGNIWIHDGYKDKIIGKSSHTSYNEALNPFDGIDKVFRKAEKGRPKFKKGQKVKYQIDRGSDKALSTSTGTISKIQKKGNSYLYTVQDGGPVPVYEPEIVTELEIPSASLTKINADVKNAKTMALSILQYIDAVDDKEQPAIFKNPKLRRAIELLKDLGDDQEKVQEIDINDPALMKARAMKIKRAKQKQASKPRGISYEDSLDLRLNLQDLEDERADVLRNMEQEAEPEGGPIADDYGEILNDLDKKIDRIMSKLRQYDMNETANPQDGKAAPFGSGFKKVNEMTAEGIKNLIRETVVKIWKKK